MRLYSALTILSAILVITVMDIPVADDGFLVHTVKKGESVSLICIDLYGYYSSELGKACQRDNPELKDIDRIGIGQKLRFHKPVSRQTEPSQIVKNALKKSGPEQKTAQNVGDASTPDSLYVRRIHATQGVITFVEGDALLLSDATRSGKKLTVNTLVYPGDIVQTQNGRVELIINRESVVRLRENTRLSIDAFRDVGTKKGKTKMAFSTGAIWTKVRKFKDKISRFELELPTAIAGVHGTVYNTVINPDSSCDVNVYSGEVSVQGGKSSETDSPEKKSLTEVSGPEEVAGPHEVDLETWTKIVRSMQKVRIGSDGKPTEPISFSKDQSNWEKWNEERDRRIAEIFMEHE